MAETGVRFGLIGYGLFGAHHARAIAAAPNAELVAIAVRSQQSQDAARQAHPSAEVYGDYRELLAQSDIDAVSVVTPNHMHYEAAHAALAAGKHVLLEKPMALKLAHCDALIEQAGAQERVLAIGHELRLSSLWGGVKRLIDDGAIGRPRHALIELSRFPYRQGSQGWRYDTSRVGSWILEEPIHFFDLARWYLAECGEPQSIYARSASRHQENSELADNFSAIVNHADGAYAVVTQTLAAFGHHQTAKITGSEGAIWARWSAADARSDQVSFDLRWGLGDDVQTMSFDKPTGELLELADEIEAMADCVRNAALPPCTAADGRWSALLCLAAERSAASGAVVDISEFVSSN